MSYKRIACLSTEAVETLYALGAEDAIAGISGFTTRPARARSEKPKVSGFSSSRIERILAVDPDLVIGFSNMQADILSPGPSAITDGLPPIAALIRRWHERRP